MIEQVITNYLPVLTAILGILSAVVYFIIYNFVIVLGLPTDYLKMLSAVIVVLFLAIPYLKSTYFSKQKRLPIQEEEQVGGNENA